MKKVEFSEKFLDTVQPKIVDTVSGYQKGHDVPAGWYLVELINVKCHSKTRYKLIVKVLENGITHKPLSETQVIVGYADRNLDGYYDLANCFANGVLHSVATQYVGGLGIISLSSTGWIDLIMRDMDAYYFPGFKRCENKNYSAAESFQRFLDRCK